MIAFLHRRARSPSPRLPSGPPHARPVPVQPEGLRGEGWGEGQGLAPASMAAPHPSPLPVKNGERGQVESRTRP
jgi:hypothetical protein